MLCSRKDDGRIRQAELAHRLSAKLDYTDQLSSIEDYLNRKSRPQRHRAWLIGETLREAGCPWASGVWTLWIGGYFDAAVGTLTIWLMTCESFPMDPFELASWLTYNAKMLGTRNRLDDIEPFGRIYVREPLFNDDTTLELNRFIDDNPGSPNEELSSAFHVREAAKQTWSLVASREDLQQAYEKWSNLSEHASLIRDSARTGVALIDAIIAISAMSYLSRDEREAAVRSVFDILLKAMKRSPVHGPDYLADYFGGHDIPEDDLDAIHRHPYYDEVRESARQEKADDADKQDGPPGAEA